MAPPEAILSQFFKVLKPLHNYYHMQVHRAWLMHMVQKGFEKASSLCNVV